MLPIVTALVSAAILITVVTILYGRPTGRHATGTATVSVWQLCARVAHEPTPDPRTGRHRSAAVAGPSAMDTRADGVLVFAA